jgi:putative transposase
VEPKHKGLTVMKQCELLGISRSSYYYKPNTSRYEKDTKLIVEILKVLKKKPFYKYRKIACQLKDKGLSIKKTRLLMSKNSLRAIDLAILLYTKNVFMLN